MRAALAFSLCLLPCAASAGPASSLPWTSGASGDPCLAQLRGDPLDATNVFPGISSWSTLTTHTTGRSTTPVRVTSLALLPRTAAGQFQACADGQFDSSYKTVALNLAANGARTNVVRLGWEANIGSDSHPWGVDTAAQIPLFKSCWRHAAQVMKAAYPNIKMDWTSAKKTQTSAFIATDLYPGGDVVDIIGVHYYDSGPEKNTQALWDKYYNMTYRGGPWGLGTWLNYARSQGKPLSVGEYGVWAANGVSISAADDPVYINNMANFFRSNAPNIAYETYFNSLPNEHMLCSSKGTPTNFPKAAAAYAAGF